MADSISSGSKIAIRAYRPEDRDAVRKICMDTAHKAYRTVEWKREMICCMFIDYNIDCEPDCVFVAVDEQDKPVGYIASSVDLEKFNKMMRSVYLPRIRRYSSFHSWFTYICMCVSNHLNEKYNGGFHINIDDGYQGMKIGPRLLTALGVHLKEKGYGYMYLVTQNRRTRGYPFYMHYGFEEAEHYFLGSIALIFNLDKIESKAGL